LDAYLHINCPLLPLPGLVAHGILLEAPIHGPAVKLFQVHPVVELRKFFPQVLNSIEVSRLEGLQDLRETLQKIIGGILLLEGP
jgi:hypothetical protein